MINLKHLHRSELDKPCFAHDAAYFDSKDLEKRTASDRILKDKAFDKKKLSSGMSVNEQSN